MPRGRGRGGRGQRGSGHQTARGTGRGSTATAREKRNAPQSASQNQMQISSDHQINDRKLAGIIREQGCSYCRQNVSDFLVQCVDKKCGLWFCNGCWLDEPGRGDSSSKESHIVSHLRISRHRKIAVLHPTSRGKVKLLALECIKCRVADAFDMGMQTVRDGRNPEAHFCRQDAVEAGVFHTRRNWIPFINVHHPVLKCFDENIVLVPSRNDQRSCGKVSREAIVSREKEWLMTEHGMKKNEDSSGAAVRWIDFKTSEQYYDHFAELVRLESQLEEVDCLATPILEDVVILQHDTSHRDFVEWFEFSTASQIHRRAFASGAPIIVNIERDRCVVTNAASIKWCREARGTVLVRVKFQERNIRVEHLGGAVGIELTFQKTMYKRWLDALKDFSRSGMDNQIKHFILGASVEGDSTEEMPATKKKGKKGRAAPLKDRQLPAGQIQVLDVEGRCLNQSQKEAVHMALTSSLSLIQGPPGTGKTHTIVALVSNVLRTNKGAKVLCCAPSNDPTDHLAAQIAKCNMRVTRITSQRIDIANLPADVRILTLRYKLEQILGKDYRELQDKQVVDDETTAIIEASDVICTTCNMAADFALLRWRFPFVIIDEATQAREADALIPITKGCQKLVLIGDEKQLGVISKFRELEDTNQCWSLFERLIELGQAPRRMLDTQYRMHPDICQPASVVMYNGLLITGVDVRAQRESNVLHFLNRSPLLIIDTAEWHEMAADGVSTLNVHEALVVGLCLVNLMNRKVRPEDIGVITFYNGQKEHLKKQVASHRCLDRSIPDKLMIDSVDAFQGREKDYIILSCVRSGHLKSTSVGFLDARRLNVGLTRAKKGVIIVGNRKVLEKSAHWKGFLDYYPTVKEKSALLSLGVGDVRHLECQYCLNPQLRQAGAVCASPVKSQTFTNSVLPVKAQIPPVQPPLKTANIIKLADLEATFKAVTLSRPTSVKQRQTATSNVQPTITLPPPIPAFRQTKPEQPLVPPVQNTLPERFTTIPVKPSVAAVKPLPKPTQPELCTSPKTVKLTSEPSPSILQVADFCVTIEAEPSSSPVQTPPKTAASSPSKGFSDLIDQAKKLVTRRSPPKLLSSPGKKKKPIEIPLSTFNSASTEVTATEGRGSASQMVLNFSKETSSNGWVHLASGWPRERLYAALSEYKMSTLQLGAKGYPVFYKAGEGFSNNLPLCKAKTTKVTGSNMSGTVRTCERCSTEFKVFNDGQYLFPKRCIYHWGKKDHTSNTSIRLLTGVQTFTYKCCGGSMTSLGCDSAPGHVSKSFASMFDFVTTRGVKSRIKSEDHNILALDCEMLYTLGGYELGRVTLVNEKFECVYDCLVLPKEKVIDYNTRFSGLTAQSFAGQFCNGVAVKSLAEVHRDLIGPIIHQETLLIGHSLEADLLCLKLIHNMVIDTSVVFRSVGQKGREYTPALRTLSQDLLKKTIQDSSSGHDSFEDAAACMALMLYKVGKEHSSPEPAPSF